MVNTEQGAIPKMIVNNAITNRNQDLLCETILSWQNHKPKNNIATAIEKAKLAVSIDI